MAVYWAFWANEYCVSTYSTFENSAALTDGTATQNIAKNDMIIAAAPKTSFLKSETLNFILITSNYNNTIL